MSTSRRSASRVIDTSKEQREPVLQYSAPEAGRISALTLYSVWKEGQRRAGTAYSSGQKKGGGARAELHGHRTTMAASPDRHKPNSMALDSLLTFPLLLGGE